MEKLTGTFLQIYDLDVIEGDEIGDYEVNDVYKGDIFEVPEYYEEEDIFNLLQDQGFLKPIVRFEDLEIIENDEFIEVFDSVTMEPLWQLWRIDNEDVLWNAKNGTNVYNLGGERLLTYADETFEFGGV